MSVTITALEAERFKRLKAVRLEPTEKGLTVIGGGNAHGKTSVLDAIAFALGGAKFKPSEPNKRDEVEPALVRLELSNGLVVERKGANGSLKVTDATGMKGAQAVLDEFIEELALDLPKFISSNSKAKAETLLRIIGVGDKLAELDAEEKGAYDERRDAAKLADVAKKGLESMPPYIESPPQPILEDDVRNKLSAANAAVAKRAEMQHHYDANVAERERMIGQVNSLRQEADDLMVAADALGGQNHNAMVALDRFIVPDVGDIMGELSKAENINRIYRCNDEYTEAKDKAQELKVEVERATEYLKTVRDQRQKLLDEAEMPLEGLAIVGGELEYDGAKWDCMSSAQQLIVATSIVRKLQPECGFVLIDKLERMDLETLEGFGKWAEGEGLQIIATRVSTGDECSVIIEDGQIAE